MKTQDYEEMAMGFFAFDFFGSELDADNQNELVEICAHRAYLDFCRTLKFNKGLEENHRYCFRKKLIAYMVEETDNLLGSHNHQTFDYKHNEICENIVAKAKSAKTEAKTNKSILLIGENDRDSFHYGQAQKWLNMTLKYMWIAGALKNRGDIAKLLHIPVDRYIIEAVYKVYKKDGVGLPIREDAEKKKLTGLDQFVSWSNWTGDEYIKFQKSVRSLYEKENSLPLKWENDLWRKVANGKNTAKKNGFEKWKEKGKDVIIK